MDQLRDPHFDAAWRAASREQPSAALDAAILSAARRAAGAGPQPADVREATRPERWWWPLAAAASIGAVALGILQLVATERAGAPAAERAIVSDMPAERSSAPARARLPEPSTPPTPAPSPAASGKAGARQESAPSRKETDRLQRNDAPPAAAPPATATTPLAEPASHDGASAAAKAEVPAAARISGAPVAADAAGTGGARNVSATAAPAVPPAMQAAPTPPPAGGVAAGSARGAQPFPGGAVAPPLMQRDAAPPSALGKVMPAPATGARTAERAPLPVAEWIALIRKLRSEGRTAELTREVAAFRAAYPDQQHLLADEPSDGSEKPRPPAR